MNVRLPDLPALPDVAEFRDALAPLLVDVPWWTIALVVLLVLRALVVVGRGERGSAWRTVLAVAIGSVVVAQLVVVGPELALLPLHVLAAFVVALIAWERPHPEAAPLKMGKRRRRTRRPWPRSLLLFATTAAAAAAYVVLA
ncbi:hypothetical protein BH23DEI1_BH23DEI1_00910 [soil metagenome]